MAETLMTVAQFINSPSGQLATGGVLAGIVWKGSERVESLLTDQTKLEIAVWLLDVKVADREKTWPETFGTMFNRVLGPQQFTLRCFSRSCIASAVSISVIVSWAIVSGRLPVKDLSVNIGALLVGTVFFNVLPGFGGLYSTRLLIDILRRPWSIRLPGHLTVGAVETSSSGTLSNKDVANIVVLCDLGCKSLGVQYLFWMLHLLLENMSTYTTKVRSALNNGDVGYVIASLPVLEAAKAYIDPVFKIGLVVVWLPLLLTSTWLWLYVGGGFLLKAARRFDIGFNWFNEKFDIEKKPLQSIGFVAGALVALVYWSAVIVSRVVK